MGCILSILEYAHLPIPQNELSSIIIWLTSIIIILIIVTGSEKNPVTLVLCFMYPVG